MTSFCHHQPFGPSIPFGFPIFFFQSDEDLYDLIGPQDSDDNTSPGEDFREEPINVMIAKIVGSCKEAETTVIQGATIRRWIAFYVHRAKCRADHSGSPVSDIMWIDTIWNENDHAIPFEGRRTSSWCPETPKDEPPAPLAHEHDLPHGLIGMSAFAAPKIIKRILRSGMEHLIGDIDQNASHLIAQDDRLNGSSVEYPQLHEIVKDIPRHRLNIQAACDVSEDVAKSFFIIQQYGGSLTRWEELAGKSVIHLLPREYVEFAIELAKSRQDEADSNPDRIKAIRLCGKSYPEATNQYYFNEYAERVNLNNMEAAAQKVRIVLASPEHDGGMFVNRKSQPGWQDGLVQIFAQHGIATAWKRYPIGLDEMLQELRKKFGGDHTLNGGKKHKQKIKK